jgi:glyoxylase-like metal-dependent hydrolase (beta-lactamase superfamily II)
LGSSSVAAWLVIRLPGGKLFVHSPCPLTVTLREELDRLGAVGFVVPASSLHGHLHMEDYQGAYPQARIYAAPGLERRRPDLHFAGTLGEEPETEWRDDVDQTTFDGVRRLTEIEFLHRASRTLITGDICFNIGAEWPLLTRLWAHGPRLRPRLYPPPAFRAVGIRDRRAARASIERILDWDFDRILPGHGNMVASGGKERLRTAFAWLLS